MLDKDIGGGNTNGHSGETAEREKLCVSCRHSPERIFTEAAPHPQLLVMRLVGIPQPVPVLSHSSICAMGPQKESAW